MPIKTEITALLIITKLEQYDFAGATAIAVVMLVASFAILLLHQPLAVVEQPPPPGGSVTMAGPIALRKGTCATAATGATSESPWLKWLLISRDPRFLDPVSLRAAGGGLHRGAAQGARRLFRQLHDPDALAAIKLTLITAAIAVPLNLVFGLAAAWSIAKFNFPARTC
jgi:ABC-type sulfate transport system permease subunit